MQPLADALYGRHDTDVLLEKLSLENYGAYEGRADFDLSSTAERPIVLIGGLNGAGKTTLLESLMVALYGRSYLGRRASKKEYAEFAAKRFHRHGGRVADFASVDVSFRFYHDGNEDGYQVRREWVREGATIDESLHIRKNGEPMVDIDESQWQAFIEGLIPLGITRLFFFDGEKISRMTEWDSPDNDDVKMSLDMLLGTELVERLRSDLDLYTVRRSSGADDVIKAEYDDLQKQKAELVSEILALKTELGKKALELQNSELKVSTKEAAVRGAGGGYAHLREELLARKAMLKERLKQRSKDVLESLGEDAPLYTATDIVGRVGRRLESEMKSSNNQAATRLIKSRLDILEREMSSPEFWPEGTDIATASQRVLSSMHNLFNYETVSGFFDASPLEAAWMVEKTQKIMSGCDVLLKDLAEQGNDARLLDKTEAELARIPRDDEIGPRIAEINRVHEEIGMLKSEISHLDLGISSKSAHLRVVQNRLKAAVDAVHEADRQSTGITLAAKMQCALDTYMEKIKERKMAELESNLLAAAQSLLHKKNICSISIDRETLALAVGGEAGDLNNLFESMGERQMMGTALLWALAKTSGRPLPFVIDTPLGRLDTVHRSNLLNLFYPSASHQVILLSTDSEIGPSEYVMLEDRLSRSYLITCDQDRSVTTVSEGYFGGDDIATA